jgi:drug/metabolite transporter (DMT)-like permease
MALAGAAWGVYSLRGRAAERPIAATAGNFLRAAPLALALSLASLRGAHVGARGALLAAVSGAVTSGLGYVIWYAALRGLTATRAATVQLAVPVLTALGAVAVLGEPVTLRLVAAGALILGGVGFAVRAPAPRGSQGAPRLPHSET